MPYILENQIDMQICDNLNFSSAVLFIYLLFRV